MEHTKIEAAVLEKAIADATEGQVRELNDLQRPSRRFHGISTMREPQSSATSSGAG